MFRGGLGLLYQPSIFQQAANQSLNMFAQQSSQTPLNQTYAPWSMQDYTRQHENTAFANMHSHDQQPFLPPPQSPSWTHPTPNNQFGIQGQGLFGNVGGGMYGAPFPGSLAAQSNIAYANIQPANLGQAMIPNDAFFAPPEPTPMSAPTNPSAHDQVYGLENWEQHEARLNAQSAYHVDPTPGFPQPRLNPTSRILRPSQSFRSDALAKH